MKTIPVPTPAPRELLIKVYAAGFCHTDSSMPIDPDTGGPLPITGSHEPAGIIVSMGEEAAGLAKFHLGDRIMAINTCRACSEIISVLKGYIPPLS